MNLKEKWKAYQQKRKAAKEDFDRFMAAPENDSFFEAEDNIVCRNSFGAIIPSLSTLRKREAYKQKQKGTDMNWRDKDYHTRIQVPAPYGKPPKQTIDVQVHKHKKKALQLFIDSMDILFHDDEQARADIMAIVIQRGTTKR